MTLFKYRRVRKYSWEILLFFSVVIFVAAKLLWAYRVVPFDPEEIYKLDFLASVNHPLYFFPGFHAKSAFYGHPGLWQFITYLTTSLFGNSIQVIRVLMLSTSILTIGAIFLICRKLLGRPFAFFCSLAFVSTPMFYFQSDLYFFELPAMLFGLVALHFYFESREHLYCLFAAFSALVLESWISLPIAILFFELLSNFRDDGRLSLNPMARSSILVLMLIVVFFAWEYVATGNFSNHLIYLGRTLKGESFLTLNGLTTGRFGGIGRTLLENFGGHALIIISCLVTSFAIAIRKYFFSRLFMVPSLVVFQFLVFFTLFDAQSGGRDYYPLILFLLTLAIVRLKFIFERRITFSIACLYLWASLILSYTPTKIFRDSAFQTTFAELEFRRSYSKLTSFIYSNIDQESVSCLSRAPEGDIICNSYFDPKTPVDYVTRARGFSGDFALFRGEPSPKWFDDISSYQLIEVNLPRRMRLNLYIRNDGERHLPKKIFL